MAGICDQILGLRRQGNKASAAAGATTEVTLDLLTGRGFIYGFLITSYAGDADTLLNAKLSASINGVQILNEVNLMPFLGIDANGDYAQHFIQAQTPGGVQLVVSLNNTAGTAQAFVNVEPMYSQDKRMLLVDYIPVQK